MKKKYLIQNQKLKRIGLLLLSILFFFSCNELDNSNFNPKFIRNLPTESLSAQKFTIIDPKTQEAIPKNTLLELGYTYLVKAYVQGKEKIYTLKGEKNPSILFLKRKKRIVPLLFVGTMIASIGILIHELVEAGKINSKPPPPLLLHDELGNRWEMNETLNQGVEQNEPTPSTNISSVSEGVEHQACSSRSLVNECREHQRNEFPENIENSLAQLNERIFNLKEQSNFNTPENQISHVLLWEDADDLDNRENLKKSFEDEQIKSQNIRSERQQVTLSINQIIFFQDRINHRNYQSIAYHIPPEFNSITADQLERLSALQLNELIIRLRSIRRIALRIDVEGVQSEFFARFLAYQSREAETLNRIKEVENKISQEGTTQERENLRNGLQHYLEEIITIQRMLLRGIALAQHTLKTGNENQLGIIWNGLMEIIKYLDKAIEQEEVIYALITNPNICLPAIDVRDSLNRIIDFFSHINIKKLFSRAQRRTITTIEQIHSIHILHRSKLKFHSIEVIKDELSDFIASHTQIE